MSEKVKVVKRVTIKQNSCQYPLLYRFLEETKYGLQSSNVDKIERDAQKLYNRISTEISEGNIIIHEDLKYDDDDCTLYQIFQRMLKTPLFVENFFKYEDYFMDNYNELNIADRMMEAFINDHKLKQELLSKKNDVHDQLKLLPPSDLLPEGGIKFQETQERFNNCQKILSRD